MGDLFPWLSDHTIRVLSMLGGFVAGIASLAAVVVSLRLARRSESLRLAVSVGWYYEEDPNYCEEDLGSAPMYTTYEDLVFSIDNMSLRTVTIKSVGVRAKRWGLARRKKVQTMRHMVQADGSVLPPGGNVQLKVPANAGLASGLGYPKSVEATIDTSLGNWTGPTRGGALQEYFRGMREMRSK